MRRWIVAVGAGVSLGLAAALHGEFRVPVFEGRANDVEPWLLLSLPHPVRIALFVALGGAIGALAARIGRARQIAPWWLAGLAGAVYVPRIFAAAPFLAAFSGRFLDFILVGTTLTVLWRIVQTSSMPEGLFSRNRIFVLGFLVYLAVGFKMSADVGLSGDEPHYLLITESLVRDGDLRVQNNYFQEDYLRFYRGKIGPHLARGTPYSIHGIGLPVLLAPGYALAGLAGVSVTLALMGAFLWRGIYETVWHLTDSQPAALVATCGFGLSSPALFLSVSAYPELPAAVVVVLVVAALSRPSTEKRHVALGWALLIGTLPFFHMKFIPLALVSWGALAWRSRTTRAWVLTGAAISLAVLASFYWMTTGSFNPTASYGRQRIFLSGIPRGLLGLLFDQEFGLLVFAPFYLAAFAGLVVLLRRHLFLGASTVAVLAAVALPGAAHPLWSGGNSVPARFLFPALPLLGLAAGCLWAWERRTGIGPWLPSLVILSLCVSGFSIFLPGQPLYLNARDGTGRLWEALSSTWDLTSYLPSVVDADMRSLVVASIFFVVLVSCIVAQRFSRSIWLPPFAVLLLAFAWAQDLTGVEHPRALEGRWVSAFMRALADNRPSGFLSMPSHAVLSLEDVKAQVPLRLAQQRLDSDPRHWWSRPYAIPAGRYRVAGVRLRGWAPCNGDTCFDSDGALFVTEVGLARFRARARRLEDLPPRLYLDELFAVREVAERSLVFSGRRLHSLDEGAYLDRRGFWVKREARARFALESLGGASAIEIANGGTVNWVEVEIAGEARRFRMDAWEKRRIALPVERALAFFAVESEGGFQPSELDPASSDHRQLGVLITAVGL